VPEPSALDVLRRELRSLVTRVRGFSATRLAAAAPPIGTRADAAFHLAAELAGLAARAETPAGARVVERPLPRLGDFTLADQLAVVGNDLVGAVEAGGPPGLAAAALGEVVLHRRDLDGSLPGKDAVVVLAVAYGCEVTPGAVLLAATERCRAYVG
jgi:hypothetical protein